MGIPKFYRWISERYPLINQACSNAIQRPDFDNLYLDMNGIIHNCSHSNDEIEVKSFSLIVSKIFEYLDRIFSLVQPKKLLFLAVDGVAPRAKMNQQRQRRFRSAKSLTEAIKNNNKLLGNENESKSDFFDSNSITPGTEFMAQLDAYFKYYIISRLSNDKRFKNVEIIYSSYAVPGEGEHKIMAYIRKMKMSPGYNPNTRHCLYGLDADLIMLSLLSHEPHFSLLREEVIFNTKNSSKKQSQTRKSLTQLGEFQLLHISVLREYLKCDFGSMSNTDKFKFNLERIIDDFVFICFLIGNDFLPHLSFFDIREGSLGVLLESYRENIPNIGYLTENGFIIWDNARKFIKLLLPFELDFYRKCSFDSNNMEAFQQNAPKPFFPVNDDEDENDEDVEKSIEDYLEHLKIDEISSAEAERNSMRHCFYSPRFGNDFLDDEFSVTNLVNHYVTGLFWVYAYYYQGCISWSWFFPGYYAPLIHDIFSCSSDDFRPKFQMGKPFPAFAQLLSVLPPQSAKLLPPNYSELMTNTNSPLVDFYPTDFYIDRNGARYEWEGNTILPFIDEDRLLKVLDAIPSFGLTQSEKKRNIISKDLLFYHDTYDPLLSIFDEDDSKLIRTLPNIPNKAFKMVPFDMKESSIYIPQLMKGFQLLPSFPSIYRLKFSFELKPVKIKVFGIPSRHKTMVLNFEQNYSSFEDIISTVSQSESKVFLINYPFFSQALLKSVSSQSHMFSVDRNSLVLSDSEAKEWKKKRSLLSENLRNQGIYLDEIEFIAQLCPLIGLVRTSNGAIKKIWSSTLTDVPFQLISPLENAHDHRFDESPPLSVVSALPLGCKIIYTGKSQNAYGLVGNVTQHNNDGTVGVTLTCRNADFLSIGSKIIAKTQSNYVSADKLCRNLRISLFLLSRITSRFYFNPGHVDIGLNFKSPKENLSVPHFARLVNVATKGLKEIDDLQDLNHESNWEYSQEAQDLIFKYFREFPELYKYFTSKDTNLHHCHVKDIPKTSKTSSLNHEDRLKIFVNWIKSQPNSNLLLLPCSSRIASLTAIKKIEQSLSIFSQQEVEKPSGTIFLPKVPAENLIVDFPADNEIIKTSKVVSSVSLGDRVIVIENSLGVPFGTEGTVVGYHVPTTPQSEEFVEVIFDVRHIFGTNLHNKCSEMRGLMLPISSIFNITRKKPAAFRAPASSPKYSEVMKKTPHSRQSDKFLDNFHIEYKQVPQSQDPASVSNSKQPSNMYQKLTTNTPTNKNSNHPTNLKYQPISIPFQDNQTISKKPQRAESVKKQNKNIAQGSQKRIGSSLLSALEDAFVPSSQGGQPLNHSDVKNASTPKMMPFSVNNLFVDNNEEK